MSNELSLSAKVELCTVLEDVLLLIDEKDRDASRVLGTLLINDGIEQLDVAVKGIIKHGWRQVAIEHKKSMTVDALCSAISLASKQDRNRTVRRIAIDDAKWQLVYHLLLRGLNVLAVQL